jgi:hypothetical protein
MQNALAQQASVNQAVEQLFGVPSAPTTGFTQAELAAGEKARAAIDAHNAAVMAGQRPGEGTTAYTPEFTTDVVNQMQKAEEERLAQQVAQSYIDYAPIMGPELYSTGSVGGSLLDFFKTGSTGGVPLRSNYFADPTTLNAFKNIALGQIPGRMEQAKAGYGMPGIAGGLMGAMGKFSLGQMQKALEAGGRPVFDKQGRLAGVFSEGLLGGEVYTGMPVEGVAGTGYDEGRDDGGQEQIKPKDPVTGQCPEGYIFDEDLQACRMLVWDCLTRHLKACYRLLESRLTLMLLIEHSEWQQQHGLSITQTHTAKKVEQG